MFRIQSWVFSCILYFASSLTIATDFEARDIQAHKCVCKENMNSPFWQVIKHLHYRHLIKTGNANNAYLEGLILRSDDTKDLSGPLSFKKADLRNVVFIGSFEDANFEGSDLTSSDLSDSNFINAHFDQACLISCNLSNGNFSHATFRHACLDGAYGKNIEMKNADLDSCSLVAAFLSADMTSSSRKNVSTELMRSRAETWEVKIIDPNFCLYAPQLRQPGRIVFEYNPKNWVSAVNTVKQWMFQTKKNNEFLAIRVDKISNRIVTVYVEDLFPKIIKNPSHRHVMHCVSNDLLEQIKEKSPRLYEELQSNLIDDSL